MIRGLYLMNSKNEVFSNLMQTLDAAKIKLNSLPKHYLGDKFDTRTKKLYASLLGSVMLSNNRVSDIEHRLFTMLLASLDIDVKVDQYLSNLDTLEVQELFEQLESDDEKQVLLFDSLLLTRCNSPLTTEQVKLISELSDLLSIDADDLIYTVYWAGKVLGIDIDLKLENEELFIQEFTSQHKLRKIETHFPLEGFVEKGEYLVEGHIIDEDFHTKSNTNKDGIKVYIVSECTGYFLSSKIRRNEKLYFDIVVMPLYLLGWEEFFMKANI